MIIVMLRMSLASRQAGGGHRVRPGHETCTQAAGLGVQSRGVGGTGTPRQRHDNACHPNCDTAVEGSAQEPNSGPVRPQPKTVAKWRKRSFVLDAPMGPMAPRSTVLSAEEEAVVVAFRRHTLLPLDDCLYALQATIPHLTRSSLHRCLQRHGISRLPDVAATDRPEKAQGLSDRLLPYRHRGGPHRRGEAVSLCGCGQALEVCLRAVARRRYGEDRRGHTTGLDRSSSLQNPHATHRQWRTVL